MEAELDKVIGCDFKRIPDVLKRLHAHKESLVNKLTGSAGAMVDSSETAWYNALHKAKGALDELNKLKKQCVSISLPSGSDTSSNRAMVLMTKYQSLVTEVKQLQNILSYISWLVRVQEISSKIEVAIATPSVSNQAVDLYVELVVMTTKLEGSRCSHLKHYVNETRDYWKQRLNDKISSEFSSLMKLLKWPLTASSSDHVISVWESIQEKMTQLVMLIIQLDQWDTPNRMMGKVPGLHDPVMLLVQLLVQPVRKRFLYHFTGDKKTNSQEKPEWYMSQVLAWIRDHSSFLEEKIQPLLEVTGVGIDVRAEFIRCLLQEVDEKLRHDLPSLSDNEVTTAHTIDELLSFERELRSSLCYYHPLPSCVGVLMEQEHFHKWITLERKYTIERLTTIMESTTAWDLQYREVVDIDVSKVTICAEQLMSLMASITDRYKLLYSPPHQLDFVGLQLELLIAFHHDLADVAAAIQPLSRQQAAYLNTALYIAMVMTEWGEQTFFLELHLYKEQLKEFIQSGTHQCYSELSLVTAEEPSSSSTSQLTGTIFDDVVKLFTELADSIEHCMASHILNSWRTKCARYRNHKWQNLPSTNDYISMELSSVACDLLVLLRQQLQFLEAKVCQAACKKIWPIILDGLDTLMISEVILMCHFNEGGGAQLQYDISRNLIPLLAQYSGLRSSQIMMRSQEACKLLTVLPGSAKLLKELLISAQHSNRSDDNSYDSAVTSLATDLNIYNLTPNDAYQVLSKRLLPE